MAPKQLHCLALSSGVILFSRGAGSTSLALIGSLAGCEMFAHGHGVQMISAEGTPLKVFWKSFDNSALLIVFADPTDDEQHLGKLLEFIFDAMVLLCGRDSATDHTNVERTQRELRVCFPLVYCLLRQHFDLFCDVTDRFDFVPIRADAAFAKVVENLVQIVDSPYGCLVSRGRLVAATSRWMQLTHSEVFLISLLTQFQLCQAWDVPIFLPHHSPKVPHRLLSFQLTAAVYFMVLCGPQPSLSTLESKILRVWEPWLSDLWALRHASEIAGNGDTNVISYLLMPREETRCYFYYSIRSNSSECFSRLHCAKILKNFFLYCAQFWAIQKEPEMRPKEVWKKLTAYICFATRFEKTDFYGLLPPTLPDYAIRSAVLKMID